MSKLGVIVVGVASGAGGLFLGLVLALATESTDQEKIDQAVAEAVAGPEARCKELRAEVAEVRAKLAQAEQAAETKEPDDAARRAAETAQRLVGITPLREKQTSVEFGGSITLDSVRIDLERAERAEDGTVRVFWRLANVSEGEVFEPETLFLAYDNFGNQCDTSFVKLVDGGGIPELRPGEFVNLASTITPKIATATSFDVRVCQRSTVRQYDVTDGPDWHFRITAAELAE